MAEHKTPRVSIIVLNYREAELTVNCVESLKDLTYPNFEIIVVDGGSGDGSVEILRRKLDGTTILGLNENRGYCGGNNFGIEYALCAKSDYIHLLNPDTLLINKEYLARLVDFMEARPDVGIVGPRVYWNSKAVVQDTILRFPGVWRSTKAFFGFSRQKSTPLGAPIEVDAINGVCVLVKASVFRKAGLLDEKMFMYCDEVEFAWRVWRAGWKVMYLPVDSVVHLKKINENPTNIFSLLTRRNTAYCIKKMGQTGEAWTYAVLSLLAFGLKVLRVALFRRETAEYWDYWKRLAKAYWSMLTRNHMDWPVAASKPSNPAPARLSRSIASSKVDL